MKVSILIPTVNRLELLRESLESARRQTHGRLEILVSDNGSTDGTRDFVAGIAAADPRVRLLTGCPVPEMLPNFNHLIGQSRGEAFCILPDDDRLLPEFAGKLAAPLAADPSIVASFCDHWIVSASGERLPEASDRNSRQYGRAGLAGGRVPDPIAIALRQTLTVPFTLYRRSLFGHEYFDVTCGGAADVDYGIRAARAGSLYYVDERLGEYRVHPLTTTATRTPFMIDGAIRVYGKYTFPDEAHERLRIAILRSRYRVKAVYACTRDRHAWRESVRLYRQAGGSLLHPHVMLSFGLAALPRGAGEAVRRRLKAVRCRGGSRAAG